MCTVSGTKCVVYINISQGSQFLGEVFFVLGFFFSETNVFQQDNLTICHRGNQSFCVFADNVFIFCKFYILTQQFGQSCSNWSQREFFFIFALRSAQMGAEDYFCIVGNQVLNGRQCSNNSFVVCDYAVFERNVKIAADKDAFAGYLDIFDCFFIQRVHRK